MYDYLIDWDQLNVWHNSGIWDNPIPHNSLISRELYYPLAVELWKAQEKFNIWENTHSSLLKYNINI